MKYFTPNLYSAINIKFGLREENIEFESYVSSCFEETWKEKTKEYESWIQSSKWGQLICNFYYRFELHNKQIKEIKDNRLFLENITLTISCHSTSIRHSVFPKWMDNSKELGIFLYDEFSEEQDLLNWEFYDSNGNLFYFRNISKIS